MLDSTPQSPNPGLSRTHSSPATVSVASSSTPGTSSPLKPAPFLTTISSPSKAETSQISAMGESGWVDDEDESRGGRARRELSVIDEQASNYAKDSEETETHATEEALGTQGVTEEGDRAVADVEDGAEENQQPSPSTPGGVVEEDSPADAVVEEQSEGSPETDRNPE